MAVVEVQCVKCGGSNVRKNGKSSSGIQRYICCAQSCRKTFQLTHKYLAYNPGIKERIVDMALNGAGIRDTSRVLSVAQHTVMQTLKKSLQFSKGKHQQIDKK